MASFNPWSNVKIETEQVMDENPQVWIDAAKRELQNKNYDTALNNARQAKEFTSDREKLSECYAIAIQAFYEKGDKEKALFIINGNIKKNRECFLHFLRNNPEYVVIYKWHDNSIWMPFWEELITSWVSNKNFTYLHKYADLVDNHFLARVADDNFVIDVVKSSDYSYFTKLAEGGYKLSDCIDGDGNNLTMLAAEKSNEESIMNFLLEHHVNDIDACSNSGDTALLKASKKGYTDNVKSLLRHSANVNIRNNDGMTALMCAIENEHSIIAAELINNGADVNIKDNKNKTALIYAASNKNSEITEALINAKADVNAKDDKGYTALMYAVMNDKTLAAKQLIEAKAGINVKYDDGTTLLIHAVKNNSSVIVEALINSNIDVNIKDKNDKTPLMYAAESGFLEITKNLISAKADVNIKDNKGYSALMYAVMNDKTSVAKQFIEAKADINVKYDDGTTLLILAIKNSSVIFDTLIEANIDVNVRDKNGKTPLMYATKNSRLWITANLIAAKADVNARDNNGDTALIHASEEGYNHIIRELLKSDAEVNVINKYNCDALFKAVSNQYSSVVQTLLDAGAEASRHYANGKTLLHKVAEKAHWKGWSDIWESLLDHGADVNARDDKGYTPLMYSLDHSWTFTAELGMPRALVQKGANVEIKANDGTTARSIMRRRNIDPNKLYNNSTNFFFSNWFK